MSTLSALVIASLLIAIILILIDSGKKAEKQMTVEDENNNVSVKSDWEITNAFFTLKLNAFLKNKFPHLAAWEFVSENPLALHYMEPGFYVRLFFKNGLTCKEHIETKNVWGTTKKVDEIKTSSAETKTSEPNQELKKPNNIETFLVKHASAINDEIEKVKAEGSGLFAYYEVDKKFATDEFMKELCKTLEENTGYEVSFESNILEIGFQNDL